MTNINKSHEEAATRAHQFLIDFLNKHEESVRGGIHDFMQISLSNLLSAAIDSMTSYVAGGHRQVIANELVFIALDSYQKALDKMKRDLDGLKDMVLQ